MIRDVIALERAELEAFADLYAAASPEVASAAGLSVHRLAEATVLAVARIDVLALNRAMGLGLHHPVEPGAIDGLVEVMRACGSARFFVPVAPTDGHEELERALEQRGPRHYNNWMRLSRGLGDVPEPSGSDLVVREIEPESAPAFGRIVATAFGYPPEIAPLTEQVVGRPGWRHYLACDGADSGGRRDVSERRRRVVRLRGDRVDAPEARRAERAGRAPARGRAGGWLHAGERRDRRGQRDEGCAFLPQPASPRLRGGVPASELPLDAVSEPEDCRSTPPASP
jgi:hypothetical protein